MTILFTNLLEVFEIKTNLSNANMPTLCYARQFVKNALTIFLNMDCETINSKIYLQESFYLYLFKVHKAVLQMH